MKRYLVIMLAILVLASVMVGCASGLTEDEKGTFYTVAYLAGYSWGYDLTAENEHRRDLFWTPPDKVDVAQKFNPKVNIRDFYIPKGYQTMKDVGNAQFPDGTPFNDKQKKLAMDANNWGFYDGFLRGVDDYLKGRRYRFGP